MGKAKGSLPNTFQYLLGIYSAGLLCFALPRLFLLIISSNATQDIPNTVLAKALFMGFRFDTVILCYLLALPALIHSIYFGLGKRNSILENFIHYFILILFIPVLFFEWADVPYFLYTNSRLNINAFQWTDTPGFILKMIFTDKANYPALTGFVLSLAIFFFLSRRAFRKLKREENYSVGIRIFLPVLFLLILFLGLRGRVSFKSPIRWGTAFFSDHAFANQLGLNPVFTLGRSWLDSKNPENAAYNLIDEDEALSFATKELGGGFDKEYPLMRMVNADGEMQKMNVVLILMESMAMKKTGLVADGKKLTPFIDSLATVSSYWPNFYSAGIHTFNGVYSSLFGMPAPMAKHPMKDMDSQQKFGGIATTLKTLGYTNYFFTTHDEQFDNMGGFLSNNDYQHIISQKNYNSSEVLSTLGVPDHVQYREAMKKMDEAAKSGPFFTTILTGSDHGPYIVPENISFVPRANKTNEKVTEYTDWALQKFFEEIQTKSWGKNTLFIVTGDHGAIIDPVYDMDLSYNHVPFIIYGLPVKKHENLGGQIDMYATIMGALNASYTNNGFGIDLQKQSRPCMYFSADDKLGCLDQEYFFVWRKDSDPSLYKYRSRDTQNYYSTHTYRADSLSVYARSMVQSAGWMVRSRKVWK